MGKGIGLSEFFLNVQLKCYKLYPTWLVKPLFQKENWSQDTFLEFQKPFEIYIEDSETWVLHKFVKAVSSQNTTFPGYLIIWHAQQGLNYCKEVWIPEPGVLWKPCSSRHVWETVWNFIFCFFTVLDFIFQPFPRLPENVNVRGVEWTALEE